MPVKFLFGHGRSKDKARYPIPDNLSYHNPPRFSNPISSVPLNPIPAVLSGQAAFHRAGPGGIPSPAAAPETIGQGFGITLPPFFIPAQKRPAIRAESPAANLLKIISIITFISLSVADRTSSRSPPLDFFSVLHTW